MLATPGAVPAWQAAQIQRSLCLPFYPQQVPGSDFCNTEIKPVPYRSDGRQVVSPARPHPKHLEPWGITESMHKEGVAERKKQEEKWQKLLSDRKVADEEALQAALNLISGAGDRRRAVESLAVRAVAHESNVAMPLGWLLKEPRNDTDGDREELWDELNRRLSKGLQCPAPAAGATLRRNLCAGVPFKSSQRWYPAPAVTAFNMLVGFRMVPHLFEHLRTASSMKN